MKTISFFLKTLLCLFLLWGNLSTTYGSHPESVVKRVLAEKASEKAKAKTYYGRFCKMVSGTCVWIQNQAARIYSTLAGARSTSDTQRITDQPGQQTHLRSRPNRREIEAARLAKKEKDRRQAALKYKAKIEAAVAAEARKGELLLAEKLEAERREKELAKKRRRSMEASKRDTDRDLVVQTLFDAKKRETKRLEEEGKQREREIAAEVREQALKEAKVLREKEQAEALERAKTAHAAYVKEREDALKAHDAAYEEMRRTGIGQVRPLSMPGNLVVSSFTSTAAKDASAKSLFRQGVNVPSKFFKSGALTSLPELQKLSSFYKPALDYFFTFEGARHVSFHMGQDNDLNRGDPRYALLMSLLSSDIRNLIYQLTIDKARDRVRGITDRSHRRQERMSLFGADRGGDFDSDDEAMLTPPQIIVSTLVLPASYNSLKKKTTLFVSINVLSSGDSSINFMQGYAQLLALAKDAHFIENLKNYLGIDDIKIILDIPSVRSEAGVASTTLCARDLQRMEGLDALKLNAALVYQLKDHWPEYYDYLPSTGEVLPMHLQKHAEQKIVAALDSLAIRTADIAGGIFGVKWTEFQEMVRYIGQSKGSGACDISYQSWALQDCTGRLRARAIPLGTLQVSEEVGFRGRENGEAFDQALTVFSLVLGHGRILEIDPEPQRIEERDSSGKVTRVRKVMPTVGL